jgi:hypothetical protein
MGKKTTAMLKDIDDAVYECSKGLNLFDLDLEKVREATKAFVKWVDQLGRPELYQKEINARREQYHSEIGSSFCLIDTLNRYLKVADEKLDNGDRFLTSRSKRLFKTPKTKKTIDSARTSMKIAAERIGRCKEAVKRIEDSLGDAMKA